MTERRNDGFTALEDAYQGYTVYDDSGDKIGKVDDLFVDENDQPEYIGVKMGFLGLKSTLIPMEIARVDEQNNAITVSQPKSHVKDAPAFDDDEEITSDLEQRVYSHYGLTQNEGERGGYGSYYGDGDDREHQSGEHQGGERQSGEQGDAGRVGPGMKEGDVEGGEFRGHSADDEGVNQSRGDDLEDEDELRVTRSEEELRAHTREREAGKINVRKRVRTEREQIRVPTRREEVSVERVPVEGRQASDTEIGEAEVSMPVTEEEVVTSKDAVVKEEIRVNKDVVQDEQVVEDEVRKEEVEIDDDTEHRGGERGERGERGGGERGGERRDR